MVGSLTAVYQLLPIYPCYDVGGGKLVRVGETDVPNINRERAVAAREFHEEIRRAVEAHEQEEEYLRGRYAIRPVIGTFQPTAQSAKARGDGVALIGSYEGVDQDGDGTVPRVSATPIEVEHEENAMFAAQRHASLQNDDPVLTQLAGDPQRRRPRPVGVPRAASGAPQPGRRRRLRGRRAADREGTARARVRGAAPGGCGRRLPTPR